MRLSAQLSFVTCISIGCLAFAQVKKISEPAGKTLDKALKTSMLIQPDAKPFHIKLQIAQTKSTATTYAATIEETWVSPSQWSRTVVAAGLSQTTVVNETGMHVVTSGDYFPNWLRSFVTALFTPVPDADEWNRLKMPLEHIELPNGAHSNPCMHSEFNLGAAPVQQVNFANVCFKDGLLDFVGAPGYGMEFHDYRSYGRLKIAHTLIDHPMHGVELVGTLVTLEAVQGADPKLFVTPDGAGNKDPLATVSVGTDQLAKLAGGMVTLPWPNPVPGHGMFTVWISLDRNGVVRETHPLNSDESGIAADMAAQLVGRHWKGAVLSGEPTQVQGAMVFSYPPAT